MKSKSVKIGVAKIQSHDRALWYFFATLAIERTNIAKPDRKKAIVPKKEARVACLVT